MIDTVQIISNSTCYNINRENEAIIVGIHDTGGATPAFHSTSVRGLCAINTTSRDTWTRGVSRVSSYLDNLAVFKTPNTLGGELLNLT